MRAFLLAPCVLAGGCLLLVDPPDSAADDGADEGVPSGPPTITEFVADQRVFSEFETITFTVSVSDPNGADDIVSGALTRASPTNVIGMFRPAEGDEWEHFTIWSSFTDEVSVPSGPLELWARFEDGDGNLASRALEIEICGEPGTSRYQECAGGVCADTYWDADHCGDCDRPCDSAFYDCYYGECCGEYGCYPVGGEPPLSLAPISPPADPISLEHSDEPSPPSRGDEPALDASTLRAFDL